MTLDASLPVDFRSMPHTRGAQPAGPRLLDIVRRRRSFTQRNAGDTPQPPPPNLRSSSLHKLRNSSSSSSTGGGGIPVIGSVAQQLSLLALCAGTAQLSSILGFLNQLRHPVRTQGVNSALSSISAGRPSGCGETSGSGGRRGGGIGRAGAAGAQWFPLLSSVRLRGSQ
jgi:hypothetical protein